MTDLNASIVLYKNSEDQIHRAMAGLLGSNLDVRLYLVDNSPDDRLAHLAEGDHRITYIFNSANLGYGSGHNVALRASLDSCAKYHLVLNPDITFDPGILPPILEFLTANPDVGNLMPRVFYADGTEQRLCKLLPTPVNVFARRFLPGRLERTLKLNEDYELRYWSGRQIANIPCLSGCMMFLQVDALRQVGIFDENYFMYFEDYDLNRRIHRSFRTVFFPDVHVVHGYNKESSRNVRLLVSHIRSALRYFGKWGWVFDRDRRDINRRTKEQLQALDKDR